MAVLPSTVNYACNGSLLPRHALPTRAGDPDRQETTDHVGHPAGENDPQDR